MASCRSDGRCAPFGGDGGIKLGGYPIKHLAVLGFALLVLASSCSKDYYKDGGLHDPNFDGNIMEFLDSRRDLFDTLAQVIRLAGFENVLANEEVTFFAPPDPTISRSLRYLNEGLYLSGLDTVKQLDQIHPDAWRFFLSKYTLKGRFVLKDFPQLDTMSMQAFPGQGYVTYAGQRVNIGVVYADVRTRNADDVEQIVKYAGYRQLHINAYGGFSVSGLTLGPVATSDIRPTNGVVHALQFSRHSFGFRASDFMDRVYATGVKPAI